MGRTGVGLALALALALPAAGCASTSRGVEVAMVPGDNLESVDLRAEQRGGAAIAADVALSIPETAVWWPTKIVGSTVTGLYDGVADGIDDAPLPILGVIASPLTASWGAFKGVFRGIAMDPYYVATTSEFASALGKPFVRPR